MKIMTIVAYLIHFIIFLNSTNSQLIKSNDVYKNVIKGVYDYYRCNCIIFFHTKNFYNADIQIVERLKNLFEFFIKNDIQATIVDIEEFFSKSRKTPIINNHLFVFLDDSNDLKIQLHMQLTPLADISKAVWLIFFRDKTIIDDFFENFHVPFDCRFMVSQKNAHDDDSEIIMEIYRISKYKQLRYGNFGRWNRNTGMMHVPNDLSLYKRRNNLHGHLLRVTALNYKPGSIVTTDRNNKIKLIGMFGSILDILQQRMNFTRTYYKTNCYGIRLKNGTWTGGVASLAYNHSDIFPSDLRMVYERLDAIDFSAPLYMTRECFYLRKPKESFSWNVYLKPFSLPIWLCIICIIFLTSLIIKLVSIFYNVKYCKLQSRKKLVKNLDIFFDIFGAFCSQAMPKSEINSITIIQFTIHLTAVVLLAAYSATLISWLAVNPFVPPFKTLEGFLKDGTYRLGVVGNSADYAFFQNVTDKIAKDIFETIIRKETVYPKNTEEGLERVCSGNKYAFLTSDLLIMRFYKKDCSLIPSEAVSLSSLSIGLPKNSPFRGLIDSHIFTLRDGGILKKIADDWKKTAPSLLEENEKVWQSVEFSNIIPLITVLIGNCCLSIIFLWIENSMYQKML